MKLIGLLGGTSWPSTMAYYRILNEAVASRLGGRHSANLILRSIDFHDMRTRYDSRWEEIPPLLRTHICELASYKPDAILVCNNALHKALDVIRDSLDLGMPLIHIVEETTHHLLENRYKRVLLLGTRLVMEDTYYPGFLMARGIDVITPDEPERAAIQTMQTLIATGNPIQDDHRSWCEALLHKYSAHADVAVLACTELPLIFGAIPSPALNLVDPARLQCERAVEFMLA